MIDIVVKFDSTEGVFKIYESSTQTLLISQTLGEGFSNLNGFLLSGGLITKSILEDQEVIYHFDSHTFQEIIKSNMSLLRRVSDIPSEFKNSVSKFGGGAISPSTGSSGFSRGSKNFQKNKMSGDSSFSKSHQKFNSKK